MSRELRPEGLHVSVLIESTFIESDTERSRAYRLEVDSASGSVLHLDATGGKVLRGASGLFALETNESLEAQTARLVFAPSPMARQVFTRMEPQDHLRIALSDGRRTSVVFDGFISSFEENLTLQPQGVQAGFTVEGQGLRKILDQAIFNWQSSMSPSDDVGFSADGQTLYEKLQGDGRKPQEIIQAFLESGFARVMKLEIGDQRLALGSWFKLASGRDWSCAYGTKYPLAYQLIFQAWGGSLWSLFTQLAEEGLHECFITYQGDPGKEQPTLVFRPRPFPGPEGDDEAWKALPIWKLGSEGAPAATAILRSRNDQHRANAFHWAWSGFTDRGATAFAAKAQFGWYADLSAVGRYGFAARQVTTQLMPSGGGDDVQLQAYLDGVEALLKRVAYQDAPLHHLEVHSRAYPLVLGPRPGMVVEDWSGGVPTTGYVASVSHHLRFEVERVEATTHFGLIRALVGVTAEAYPSAVRGKVNLERVSYLKPRAMQAAQDGASAPPRAQTKGPADASGIPFATTIRAAASKHSVPPAVLAAILKQESGFNRSARNPNSSAAGIAQFLETTADDLGRRGCLNPDGTPFRATDRMDAEKSIHAASWYLDDIAKQLKAHGFPKDHPAFWSWVAYGYNQGPGTASTNGPQLHWDLQGTTTLPIVGKNDPNYWLGFHRTVGLFGGLA
jgi:hypothetical protein